jgi:hypothetical protein
MLTQPQLLDITNTITNYSDILPTLFTNEAQDVVTSILYNLELDEEGHTTLGIILDPINSALILMETESGTFSLTAKYQMAGIATLNDLSFSIEMADYSCIACELGSGDRQDNAEGGEVKDTNKQLLH